MSKNKPEVPDLENIRDSTMVARYGTKMQTKIRSLSSRLTQLTIAGDDENVINSLRVENSRRELDGYRVSLRVKKTKLDSLYQDALECHAELKSYCENGKSQLEKAQQDSRAAPRQDTQALKMEEIFQANDQAEKYASFEQRLESLAVTSEFCAQLLTQILIAQRITTQLLESVQQKLMQDES